MAWNRPSETQGNATSLKRKEPGSSFVKGIVAAAVVVVGASVAWLLLSSSSEISGNDSPRKQTSRIAKVGPQSKKPNGTGALPDAAGSGARKGGLRSGPEAEAQSAELSSQTNAVVTNAAAKVHRPVFKTASESLLALVLNSLESDAAMPPLPMVGKELDAEFRAAMKRPIRILPTDTDKVKAVKQAVMDSRKEILARMDAGASLNEVLNQVREEHNENLSVRAGCQKELNEIAANGDREGALQFFKTMNDALGQMGIRELHLPRSIMTKEERVNASRLQMEKLRHPRRNK